MEYAKERSLHQHDIDRFEQDPIKRPPTLAARIDDAMRTLAVQIEEQPPRDFMKDVKHHMNKAMDLSAAAGRGDIYTALKAVLVQLE
jgi:ribosome-associated translation inhibitor RaiA